MMPVLAQPIPHVSPSPSAGCRLVAPDGRELPLRSATLRSEALFRALGRAIHSLGGAYYTGEDVGTNPTDMDWAGQETPYVLGRSKGGSGDPSPVTARGVLLGIKAAVRHRFDRDAPQAERPAQALERRPQPVDGWWACTWVSR